MVDATKLKLEAQDFIKKLSKTGSHNKEDLAFFVQDQFALSDKWTIKYIDGLIKYGFVSEDPKTGVLCVLEKTNNNTD